jgi:glycosyl transferase family 25
LTPAVTPPVFLINLDRSPERLQRCEQVLQAMGVAWERVSGVDGGTLSAGELARLNPHPPAHSRWYRALTPGEIGCFLSHLKCWRLIAERRLACALILEDDFAPEDSVTPQRLDILAASAPAWDVLKLTRLGEGSRLVATLDDGIELRTRGRGPVDCTGYMVSLAGARKLVVQREHLYRPVDFELKHYWERDLRVYSSRPNFFRQISHEEAPSVIGDRTQYRRYPWRDKAAVYLRKYRFQATFWLLDQWHKHRRP